MQTYHYRAVTESGQVRTGRTEALNLADLESRLTQIKLELIEARSKSTASFSASWGAGVKPKDLITFCLHLAQVTRAGISLLEGLKDLVDQVENPRFRGIIGAVVDAIQSGTQFADALAAYPKTFHMIGQSRYDVQDGAATGEVYCQANHFAVTDQGSGFIPIPRDPDHHQGGYGLYLVEKQATDWGVHRQDGTCVWFEMASDRG